MATVPVSIPSGHGSHWAICYVASLPPSEITRFWTTGEIDLAIRTLERRIHDIEALPADGVHHCDPRLRNLEQSIRDTILEAFGIASPQFYRHEFFKIDNGPPIMGADVDDLGEVNELRQAQFVERIRGLVDSLQEIREALAARIPHPLQKRAI